LSRDRILIVAPYGIGLRDLLLNEALGSHLREQYELDVLSPFRFPDPGDWGLRTAWPVSRGGRIGSKLAGLNHRASHYRWLLNYERFYLATGWRNVYRMQLLTQKERPKGGYAYNRWAKLGNGPWGRALDKILATSPWWYPNAALLDSEGYRAVFVVHPVDGECTIMAQAAARRGIPVVTLSMGMDNLMSAGPMMMHSDLVLLWGPDQLGMFQNHHVSVNPLLEGCKPAVIGGLCHDRFINGSGIEAFNSTYPQVGRPTRVVTYAAFSELAYPKQTQTCLTILETLDRVGVDAHLVVRLRPFGADDEVWREFVNANPGRVTIQQAAGISFTKSGARQALPVSAELAEIELFAATLRRSSLVIVGGLSTVYLDACAAGAPVAMAALSPRGEKEPTLAMVNCAAYGKDIPSLGMIEFTGEFGRLEEIVSEVVSANRSEALVNTNRAVYSLQAGERDGRAGERAVAAIESLIGG